MTKDFTTYYFFLLLFCSESGRLQWTGRMDSRGKTRELIQALMEKLLCKTRDSHEPTM